MQLVEFTAQSARYAALVAFGIPALLVPILGVRITSSKPAVEATTARLTLSALTVSALASLWLCVAWAQSTQHALEIQLFEVGIASEHGFDFTLLIDSLSLTMMLVTSVIALLVGRFSVHYLHREPGFHRFFVVLNMFVAGMQLIVMSGTLDLLFAGWELVGLASILLIGYFRHRAGPVRGTLRAMITYRITDVGLLFAAVMMHHVFERSDFVHAFGQAPWPPAPAHVASGPATVIALLLLVSVSGKSALFPFSGWLPRAMEGPTPSSALFYGALSIHAGVYLLLVAAPLFLVSNVASGAALLLGIVTAVHATIVGRVQSDAKNRLAYATIAQVGLMVAAVGLHLFYWVVVHMIAHVCLRLYQLLRTPSALRDAQEMRAALEELPPARPSALYRMLPKSLADRVYYLALHRFFQDELLERIGVHPLMVLAHFFDRFDRGFAALLEPRASRPAPAPSDVKGRDMVKS